MDVLRSNFKETLPDISASIKKADFLVIDAEFTGLMNGRDVSLFDLPKDYYKCLLEGSTEFLVIQYGMCAFYWDEEKKHYMNDAFNFYLFPRGKPGPDKIFLCQSSSLDFLSAQGFDFNKVIRDGISYMTEPVETKLREQLTERHKSVKEKDGIIIPDEHKAYIQDIIKKVKAFLENGEKDEIIIDRCNAFVRLILYQELKNEFKESILIETLILENKNRVLKVLRSKSQADEKLHATLKKEKEWQDLEDAVGFSKVARMISQSEKLVIGHNMLLDVIHTLNRFFQPLPDDYHAFKEFAHCMFPSLLDTKYMSSLPPFKDKVNSSVLHHLLATLSEQPFSLPVVGTVKGRGYTRDEEKHHEAGYDAYITGLCFLSMHSHLIRMRSEENMRVSHTSPILKPFVNKLFLAKTAHQDSPYMNLSGADPIPSRDHVFYLTFPKEWVRNDINLLFSPYGAIVCQFVDESHAIVALARRDQARAVLRGVASNTRVKLISYDSYKAMMQVMTEKKEPPPKDTPEKFKRTCAITKTVVVKSPVLAPKTTAAASSSNVPAKVPCVRSAVTNNVAAVTSPPAVPTRKRTSSGLFQVDEMEPPPKKIEYTRSNSDAALKPQTTSMLTSNTVTNGRRKNTETPEKDNEFREDKKENKDIIVNDNGKGKKERKVKSRGGKEREVKISERLANEEKSKCVSAFKESDSWD